MIESCVVAAALNVQVGPRVRRGVRADPEEVVFRPPDVVEPYVCVCAFVYEYWDVDFALKASVEFRRADGGEAELDGKEVSRRELDAQPDARALLQATHYAADIPRAETDRGLCLAQRRVSSGGPDAAGGGAPSGLW